MTKFSIRSFLVAATIAAVFATNVHAEDDGPEGSLYSIPGSALAFVHVDLAAIADSSSLAIPREIVLGVKKELNQVFENNTGIRPTELMDITFMVSSLETAMAAEGNSAPGVFLLAFSSNVRVEQIGKTLDREWTAVTVEGQPALINETKDKAIFQHADNMLAVGPRDQVQWFIDNRDFDDYSPLDSAVTESEYGQIIVGIDGSKIPDEMVQVLPPEFGVMANVSFAAISFDLVDCITMDSVIEFDTVKNAKQVSKLANVQLDSLRGMIGAMEDEAMQTLVRNQGDMDKAIEPLVELAFYRYAKKLAEDTEVQQFRNRLMAHIGIEGIDGTMVLAGVLPAAIGAMGNAATEQFELISSQIEAQ